KPGKKLITLQIPLSQLPQDIPTEGAKFFPMDKGVVDYGVPEKSELGAEELVMELQRAPESKGPLQKFPGVLVLGSQAFQLNPVRIAGEIKLPWVYIGGGLILLAFLLLILGYRRFNAR
ncbi:MAG: hypothetical protein R3257_07305, partial [bacterium]|nr:hypothetical protein [bacterium]